MTPISPVQLRETRLSLGLSSEQMANLLLLGEIAGSGAMLGKTVRRWEAGEHRIPMSIQLLVLLIKRQKSVRDFLKIQFKEEKTDA